MKKVFLTFFFVVTIFLLIINFGCKTAEDEDVAQYTLTVTVGDGVTGNPATGTYTHSENDVVNYNYSLQEGYKNLMVTLDGVNIPASGSITITGNHILSTTAEEDYDIRGTWSIIVKYDKESYESYGTAKFHGQKEKGDVALTGNLYYGSYGKGDGTFTVDFKDITVKIFSDDGGIFWAWGQFDDLNTMSGKWDDNRFHSGTWIATR